MPKISRIVEEFERRREFLKNISWNNDREPIVAFLNWLESDLETKAIVNRVRLSHDIIKLMPSESGFRSGPKISSPDEAVAFGLFLMQRCTDTRGGLFTHSSHLRIKPRYSTNHGQDYIDAAMEQFIIPFLNHVESELEKRNGSITPDQTADFFFAKVFSSDFEQTFPVTSEQIRKISTFCGAKEVEGSWFTVGTTCRETLNTFVKELRDKGLVDPAWDLKAGDTKGTLKKILSRTDQSRSSDALIALVAATWDLTQSIVHRSSATKEEALRVFLWTGLALSEVTSLIGPVIKLPDTVPIRAE